MTPSRHLQSPINPAARARLVDAYSPGARVLRARRLRGGIGARTQVLDLEHAGGRREKVVLRAYLPGRATHTAERAAREFRTIALLDYAGVPAPLALFLDAAGRFLSQPSMLLSYLSGRSLHVADDLQVWAGELARAMASIHSVTPDRFDLTWLPPRGKDEIAREVAQLHEGPAAKEDPLVKEALDVLQGRIDRIEWPLACLVHEDFWPGNTVWYRGRLVGVIDWSNASVGDWRKDISQCCVDALWINGPVAVPAIREAYRRVSGRASADQWYFDLLIGLSMLRSVDRALLGYHDAGLTFVTPELAEERTRTFMREAMTTAATRAL